MKRCISSKDEKYYTNMLKVMNAIKEIVNDYNWLISDIETNKEFNLTNGYSILNGNELMKYLNENVDLQYIWGCFSAIPKHYLEEDILKYEIPYVKGNNNICRDKSIIQHPLAEIEIDAIDSSFIQIIAKTDEVIELFRKSFPFAEIE